jgi:hypothetical protein
MHHIPSRCWRTFKLRNAGTGPKQILFFVLPILQTEKAMQGMPAARDRIIAHGKEMDGCKLFHFPAFPIDPVPFPG